MYERLGRAEIGGVVGSMPRRAFRAWLHILNPSIKPAHNIKAEGALIGLVLKTTLVDSVEQDILNCPTELLDSVCTWNPFWIIGQGLLRGF